MPAALETTTLPWDDQGTVEKKTRVPLAVVVLLSVVPMGWAIRLVIATLRANVPVAVEYVTPLKVSVTLTFWRPTVTSFRCRVADPWLVALAERPVGSVQVTVAGAPVEGRVPTQASCALGKASVARAPSGLVASVQAADRQATDSAAIIAIATVRGRWVTAE